MSRTSGAGTVDVGGRRISYLAAGDSGSPVLFLHGFAADRLSWLLTQKDAAAHSRTVAIDLPGHGESDRDVGSGEIGTFTDLVGKFIAARGECPVHVVGHSLGGAVGIDLAYRSPERVASLFLIAPAGLGGGIDPAFLAALTGMESLDQAAAVLGRLVTRRRLISPQMTARTLSEISAPGARDALRRVADRLLTINESLAPAVRAVASRPLPKTIVWGRDDEINPPEDDPAPLGASLHLIEGAGHLPHIESPGEVNALLRAFLVRADGVPA